jgi:microcystin-dependent protein
LYNFLLELQSGHFYCPVGMISPFAGSNDFVPSGWLVCDGRSYANSGASADLQAILIAAGFANNLPDLRGKVIAGVGTILGSDRLVGASVGSESLPEHSHTFSGTTAADGVDHSHGYEQKPGYSAAFAGNSGIPRAADNNGAFGAYPTNTGGASAYSHTHTFSGTTAATGSGTHGVVQPTVVLNYIIKN